MIISIMQMQKLYSWTTLLEIALGRRLYESDGLIGGEQQQFWKKMAVKKPLNKQENS